MSASSALLNREGYSPESNCHVEIPQQSNILAQSCLYLLQPQIRVRTSFYILVTATYCLSFQFFTPTGVVCWPCCSVLGRWGGVMQAVFNFAEPTVSVAFFGGLHATNKDKRQWVIAFRSNFGNSGVQPMLPLILSVSNGHEATPFHTRWLLGNLATPLELDT